MPEHIAETRRGRADVRMRIVAVDAPGLQRALHDEVVAGATDVIHHFFATIFLKRFADAGPESFEHFVPRSARPLATAPGPVPFHRIEDAVGVVNLRDGGGALRAQASATRRVLWIAFKLFDLSGLFVDVGEQSAG